MEYKAFGIDVSQFNGDLDIVALKPHVDFIIIRCGFGSDYDYQDDAQYRANVTKCLQAGVPFGVYLYSYAKNQQMAKSEAAHTLRLLREFKGAAPLYGVWYDVEDNSLPYGEALIDNCLTYWQEITRAGYYCGIYASLSWMLNRLNSPRIAHIDRWVAQWNQTLDYPGAGIWQYTDSGMINSRRFDFNRAFRDYPAIIKGDEDMTKDEVERLAREISQQVYDENERRYPTMAQVPQWAREDIERVYKDLGLTGTGSGSEEDIKVNASHTYVRTLYVISKLMDELERYRKAEQEHPDE